MADDSDDSQKTEDPTGHKLSEAQRRGEFIVSQEVKHFIMIGTVTLVTALFLMSVSRDLKVTLQPFLEQAGRIPADGANLTHIMGGLGLSLLSILAVPILFFIAAAIGATVVQHPIAFTLEKIQPDFKRVSIMSGLGRLFGRAAFVEFIKGVLKLTIVGTVGVYVMMPEVTRLESMPMVDLFGSALITRALVVKLLLGVASILAVIAALDYFYQRYEFMQKQRMTKQEVRDEFKQMEGDPMVKAKIRQIRMERARIRMMSNVPKATVVVTNPTHYAVALLYDGDTMAAPQCVAKGVDQVALNIREVAKEAGVPIVENPPLARALYAAVEIEEEIPSEHFKAVAEVIGYVWKLKGKIKPGVAGARPGGAGARPGAGRPVR